MKNGLHNRLFVGFVGGNIEFILPSFGGDYFISHEIRILSLNNQDSIRKVAHGMKPFHLNTSEIPILWKKPSPEKRIHVWICMVYCLPFVYRSMNGWFFMVNVGKYNSHTWIFHGFYWVIFRFPTIRITLEECHGAVIRFVVKKCFPFLMNFYLVVSNML